MQDFDAFRSADIMKQGFAKRLPAIKDPRKARICEINAALAGKRGYQSSWAIASLKEELASLSAGATRKR